MSYYSISFEELRKLGAKSFNGSPLCQRCGYPQIGWSDLMYPPRFQYGCKCALSDWKNTYEDAKKDYQDKMKALEED